MNTTTISNDVKNGSLISVMDTASKLSNLDVGMERVDGDDVASFAAELNKVAEKHHQDAIKLLSDVENIFIDDETVPSRTKVENMIKNIETYHVQTISVLVKIMDANLGLMQQSFISIKAFTDFANTLNQVLDVLGDFQRFLSWINSLYQQMDNARQKLNASGDTKDKFPGNSIGWNDPDFFKVIDRVYADNKSDIVGWNDDAGVRILEVKLEAMPDFIKKIPFPKYWDDLFGIRKDPAYGEKLMLSDRTMKMILGYVSNQLSIGISGTPIGSSNNLNNGLLDASGITKFMDTMANKVKVLNDNLSTLGSRTGLLNTSSENLKQGFNEVISMYNQLTSLVNR